MPIREKNSLTFTNAKGGGPESDARDDSAVETEEEFDMARPRKQESIEKKILDVETRVAALKKEYEVALSQLKSLREQQRLVQAQRLLDAMDKKGKSFEEVLRLVNL